MLKTKTLAAVLTISTALTSGAAFAQSPTSPPAHAAQQPAAQQQAGQQQTAQQQTAEKDFARLSKDGSRAFQDLALARLAIFDGRTDDAKKYVEEADTSFSKAKTDDTVFTKAEADLKSPVAAEGTSGTNANDKSATNGQAAPTGQTATNDQAQGQAAGKGGTSSSDMTKPVAWLPVDGELSITDDFSASSAKANAVADANKSLAKGDRKGALDKLRLADVNLGIVLAVVPVNQTVSDVHQAAQLVNDGKFYEASQMLRKVQDSARFDVADIVGVPKNGNSSQHTASSTSATH